MAVDATPEARLLDAQSALRRTHERHQLALMAGRLGSWELNLITMELESSDGCKRNFGLRPDDPLPYSRLLEMILPDDRPAMQASVQQAIESGVDYTARYRIRRPDDQVRWIAAYGRPFFAADGTPEIMLGTTQDITDQVEAQQERERLLAEADAARVSAERAVRMRDDFLSTAVHDLRNPLTSMRGQTQMLQRRLGRIELPPDVREKIEGSLAQLVASASQMEELLADLQDVAFLQIGRPLELRREPTDLTVLVQSCLDPIRPQARTHEFRLVTPGTPVVADVDGPRMARVFDNLLSNAVKYSPEGGSITITIGCNDATAAVSVSDEGVGIPATEMEMIFERFRRGSNVSSTFSGMGIGLAGARSVVRQHGGTLTVESVEGNGSTFTVHVPIASAT